MIDFNRNVLAIIVSDIHIGNEFSRIEEFKNFLKEILRMKRNNQLPFLRALIILGDLFDLMATSFEDLCSKHNNEYFSIYNAFDKIKNNGIEVILVLGNHEISTSTFYNYFFSARKIEFIKKFDENLFSYNFLAIENLCQYLILTSYENRICLYLIDSIYEEPFRWINLANRSFLNDTYYFMTHGYQFEDKDFHHFITGLWDIGKIINEDWKKLGTCIWAKIKNFFGKRDISRFYDNIRLNHENLYIIFGHTHEYDIKDVRKLNTGCWLSDIDPSFLEIYIDGTCDLFKIV